VFERAEADTRVMVDAEQLEAALVNLVANARDAMEAPGTIRIATRIAPPRAGLHPEAVPGRDYLHVSVADDGPGMREDVRLRAMEPFFTTKDVGRGSGLGLSQVFGFASQSGGFAFIDSTLGEGTRVTMAIPLAEVADASGAVCRGRRPVARGHVHGAGRRGLCGGGSPRRPPGTATAGGGGRVRLRHQRRQHARWHERAGSRAGRTRGPSRMPHDPGVRLRHRAAAGAARGGGLSGQAFPGAGTDRHPRRCKPARGQQLRQPYRKGWLPCATRGQVAAFSRKNLTGSRGNSDGFGAVQGAGYALPWADSPDPPFLRRMPPNPVRHGRLRAAVLFGLPCMGPWAQE